MERVLELTGDAAGLNIRLIDRVTTEGVARLDRGSVSKIVGLLLGTVCSGHNRPADVSGRYLLMDGDCVWLEELLSVALNHRSAKVRCRALFALSAIAGARALRFLESAQEDEDENVRWVARRAKGAIEREFMDLVH
jgi:HEAT repeat protein